MKKIFTHITNKCKQYTNRIFYTCANNNLLLSYTMLFNAMYALDQFIANKLKNDEPYITIVSENILFKSIVFLYCFFTSTKLIMLSPKFSTGEIVNTILSRRGINILFIDKEMLSNIENFEEEEGINITNFFNYIETTIKMLEIILDNKHEQSVSQLTTMIKKGRRKILTNPFPTHISILSPGTTFEPCITNVSYNTLGKSMLALSYFMGLKPGNKVSVIADFEFYPGMYTILGLLNGIQFVLPEKDTSMYSGEELKDMINKTDHKPEVIFISSNNFKKVWDTILLKVYSNKLLFMLSKYLLTKWIVNKILLREILTMFGKQVQKVHILNEELGFFVLDILKKSKIMFTSSYGFLEEGNFLAFKDPEVFKHKNFIYKPGGTLLKDNENFFNKVFINLEQGFISTSKLEVGEICVNVNEDEEDIKYIPSDDLGMLIPNIPNQGDRKFLFVYGKSARHKEDDIYLEDQASLDLIERSLKDNWLIRDCFLQRNWENNTDPTYNLFVEIREDLLDVRHISWEEIESTVRIMAMELDKNSSTRIDGYAILKFNGMRNIADKLQYYNM